MFHLFKKPLIVFVYSNRYKYSGSTVMRGEQLSSILKNNSAKEFRIKYKPLSLSYSDATIILSKGAVTDITTDDIKQLISKGNRVLLDPVDNPLDEAKASLATGVIAASLEAYDDYGRRGFRTYLVNHHVDTRLSKNIIPPQDHLRSGYFGELVNTVTTDKLATMVDYIHIDTGKQTNDWLKIIEDYNLHYCIRSNNVQGFKPFLKGFTAAACGANIIIQKDQREAVRWLGEDYPYLVRANPSETDIINMLDKIQKDFGGETWNKAIQKMKEIKQKVSDESIADELKKMIKDTL